MNTAIIVMTLLGCGQSNAACDYIRTVEMQFASRAECEAQMDAELLKTASAGYPDVIAVCEPRRDVAELPGLPDPVAAGDSEIGEPKVIMMPQEAEPRKPLKRLAEKTGEMMNRFGAKLRSGWKKIIHPRAQSEEPVLLGEFTASDG